MKQYRRLYLTLILTFILGIQGEKIALWKTGTPNPIRIFPYRVETLPPEARAALEKGIHVESREELEALAENYLS